jgi:hypothetical protein
MYVRDGESTFARALETCSWVALHRSSSRRGDRAARARAAGKGVYLYSLVDGWTPSRWRAELTTITAEAIALGADGIICDPEGGWSGDYTQARALGAALAGVSRASGLSVGVTSYPAWGGRRHLLAGIADADVWVSPQCYYKDTAWGDNGSGLGNIRRWIEAWGETGRAVVPGVSCWQWASVPATADAWARYFGAFPPVRGAIGWPISGPSGVVLAAWQAFRPSPVPAPVDEALSDLERIASKAGVDLGTLAALLGGAVVLLLAVFFATR